MATVEELEQQLEELRAMIVAVAKGGELKMKSHGFRIGNLRIFQREVTSGDDRLYQEEPDGTQTDLTTAGSGGTRLQDADADTKVQVEKTADDDTWRVDCGGSADRVKCTATQFTCVPNADFSGGVDVTGNVTVTGTVDGVDIAARDHAEAHDVASHSDTTATGTELETLTDGSDADALHDHATLATAAEAVTAVEAANPLDMTNAIQVDDIDEHTGAHGVEIDGVLLKDDAVEVDAIRGLKESGGQALDMGAVADGKYLKRSGTDIVGDAPAGGGDLLADGSVPLSADWDMGGQKVTSAEFSTDVISEEGGGSGVTIDDTKIKDNYIYPDAGTADVRLFANSANRDLILYGDESDGDYLQYDENLDTWNFVIGTATKFQVGSTDAISGVNIVSDTDSTDNLGASTVFWATGYIDKLYLTEQADASADIAAKGQIWVNTATPNELWFTDDAGNDTQLGAIASATLAGKVELATAAEINTGTDTGRAMPVDQFVASNRNIRFITFRLIEADTACAADTTVGGDWVCPFTGTLLQSDTYKNWCSANNDTAGVTGTMVVDVHKGGVTVMTTNKLDIETGEKSTNTATTQPDLTVTAVTAGDVFTFDIDAVHSGTAAKGLSVTLAIRMT